MSAPHPILDRLGRDFDRLLAPGPAAEPAPDAGADDEPADPGATIVCCLVCGALACLGAPYVTGGLWHWPWIAGALLVAAQLVCWFWPRPRA